ncbi:MAG: DUF5683 domain-containing protein [Candidatus Cyclobacteriaceae bacterium M2_1C_046]
MRLLITLSFLIAFNSLLHAQETDTLYTGSDTLIAVDTDYAKRFDPKKASLYSAALPGLGQAYNKSYWKIPIVYGGFVALYFTVDYYHEYYNRFRKDLFAEIDDNPLTINQSGHSVDNLRRLVEDTRRERDFYLIITGVFYFLQIAEAHIDSHLKEFKLNPELRVSVEPQVRYAQGINSGLSVRLKF